MIRFPRAALRRAFWALLVLVHAPALVGVRLYWQGFIANSGSPLSIGISHTGGLAMIVVL